MNKLTLGLIIGLGILLLLVGVDIGLRLKSSKGLLGSAQSYPLHLVSNPTSEDQGFFWGGIENAGALWQTGALNASSSLTVVGSASLQSTVSVGTTTLSGHLISGGGTPTVAVGGSNFVAGTLTGNDTAGVVSSTPAGNAGQITVNFGRAFASSPICVVAPATLETVTTTPIIFVTSSASAFSINYNAGAKVQANNWNYHCIQ